jgi:hypothetical protein
VFDCLVSADLSVRDPEAVASLLVDKLGLPSWEPGWVHDLASRGYLAYFLRAQRNRTDAPTAIEVVGPHPSLGYGGWGAHLRGAHELQGDRPMKTHSTVCTVPDVKKYAARLGAAGVPFVFDGGSPELPFEKLWVGRSVGTGYHYDPSFDSGLMIELVPTAVLRLRPAVGVTPSTLAEGDIVRVAARSFIVDDVDQSVRTLSSTLDWRPSDVGFSETDNCRVITFAGEVPASAKLELIQPNDDDSPAACHHRRFGGGAYRITFAVKGLAAATRKLDAQGLSYAIDEAPNGEPVRVRIDPACLGGFLIDFVEI